MTQFYIDAKGLSLETIAKGLAVIFDDYEEDNAVEARTVKNEKIEQVAIINLDEAIIGDGGLATEQWRSEKVKNHLYSESLLLLMKYLLISFIRYNKINNVQNKVHLELIKNKNNTLDITDNILNIASNYSTYYEKYTKNEDGVKFVASDQIIEKAKKAFTPLFRVLSGETLAVRADIAELSEQLSDKPSSLHINTRFDKASADINTRFDKASADINTRFDEILKEIKNNKPKP